MNTKQIMVVFLSEQDPRSNLSEILRVEEGCPVRKLLFFGPLSFVFALLN